ncbi:MAG: PTS sugar transporter subunit IIB [Liquorilactobacillus hordei]|uniref:PTS galactitol transporter subunit IIB n=1 Tax=Liquorilactobacillus hordei TaxID=468911 RepID=A0A3S6QW38_9LACO|nr:PTS sugar transporter subunit IIB [Liquorilactobacillus hordei]AUJ30445.1 PTS galactitol transporter subunit IIB [Liquorilactobacillus hordei]
MKSLMIVCGTGVATSTIVTGKIKTWLEEKNYTSKVALHQGKITDIVNTVGDYDAVISTTMVPERIKDQVINGVPLLTGANPEAVFSKVEEKLELK